MAGGAGTLRAIVAVGHGRLDRLDAGKARSKAMTSQAPLAPASVSDNGLGAAGAAPARAAALRLRPGPPSACGRSRVDALPGLIWVMLIRFAPLDSEGVAA